MAIIIAAAVIAFILLSNAISAWIVLSFISWLFNTALVTKGAVVLTTTLITVLQILVLRSFNVVKGGIK